MKIKEKINNILLLLDEHYPQEDKCYLNYTHPYELMISTILSAQCTDDRVNIVTKDLYRKYPTLEAFANADVSEMEQDVKSTGFYRNKAKNIISSSRKLLKEYGSEMPSDINELIKFAGVGRKTANVIRCHIFSIPSIVVDTHVMRISYKLGLTKLKDPVKIEFDLMKKLPKEHWIRYNQQIIAHGRAICKAPTPKCEICFMTEYCTHFA